MSNATDRINALQAQKTKIESELDNLSGEEGKVRSFIDALVEDSRIEIEASPSQIASVISMWEYWKATAKLAPA